MNGRVYIPVEVVGLTRGASGIAAGGSHTCALSGAAGNVKCWGMNWSGELGDGTTTSRSVPVDVAGLTSRVIAVAAGGQHTCALTAGGSLKCWGNNSKGQLGDGTTTKRTTPVNVMTLTSGVIAVAVGEDHTCALTAGRGLKCWGNNSKGQLGDGTTTNRLAPVDVVTLGSGVSLIAAGYLHTCALTIAGGAKCWGDNTAGQLGDGTGKPSRLPVTVVLPTNGLQEIKD